MDRMKRLIVLLVGGLLVACAPARLYPPPDRPAGEMATLVTPGPFSGVAITSVDGLSVAAASTHHVIVPPGRHRLQVKVQRRECRDSFFTSPLLCGLTNANYVCGGIAFRAEAGKRYAVVFRDAAIRAYGPDGNAVAETRELRPVPTSIGMFGGRTPCE